MGGLSADFTPSFKRDLKKNASRRNWDLSKLEKVIDLVLENSCESIAELKRRHGMHTLSEGKWDGRNECHICNAGDWLLIWRVKGDKASFERTGSHDELFRNTR